MAVSFSSYDDDGPTPEQREIGKIQDRVRAGKTPQDQIALAKLEVAQVNLEIQRVQADHNRNGGPVPEYGPGGKLLGYKRDKSVPFTVSPYLKRKLDKTKLILSDLENAHFSKVAQDRIDAARKNILDKNKPNSDFRQTKAPVTLPAPNPSAVSDADRRYNAQKQNLDAQNKLYADYRKSGKPPPYSEVKELNDRHGTLDLKFMKSYEDGKKAAANNANPKGKNKPARLKRPRRR